MAAWEIWDWRGEDGQCVSVCDRAALERMTGRRGQARIDFLQEQREAGVLLHGKNRLQQVVRIADPAAPDGIRRLRMYAFRCRLRDLEATKPKPSVRAIAC